MLELLLLFLVLCALAPLYWRLVGINLSVTSVFFGAIWLVHGIGYIAFSRIYGPGVFEFFQHASRNKFAEYLMCARDLGQYHFVLQSSINLDIIPTLDLAIGLMFIGLIAGCLGADKICGNTPKKLQQALQAWKQSQCASSDFIHSRTVVLTSIAALLFLLYFMINDQQASKVWQYFASQGGEFEKIRMRQLSGGSDSYFFNLMLGTTLPFLCFYLIALQKRGQSLFLLLTLTLIGLVILAKLALLSKAPVVVFFAQMCLVFQLKKSLHISGTILWTVLAAATALLLMTLIANPELKGIEVAGFVLYRIFMAPNEALLEYFASIPHFIAHTGGQDNRILAYILQVAPLEATHFRVSELYRGVKGYSTNTMFLGDAWAQFRWVGVLAYSVLAGFIFRWVDIQMIAVQRKSAVAIAGIALAYFAAFTALSTALQTSLLTGGLLMVLPLVWFFSTTSQRATPLPTP